MHAVKHCAIYCSALPAYMASSKDWKLIVDVTHAKITPYLTSQCRGFLLHYSSCSRSVLQTRLQAHPWPKSVYIPNRAARWKVGEEAKEITSDIARCFCSHPLSPKLLLPVFLISSIPHPQPWEDFHWSTSIPSSTAMQIPSVSEIKI